jgi:hypothetical protein
MSVVTAEIRSFREKSLKKKHKINFKRSPAKILDPFSERTQNSDSNPIFFRFLQVSLSSLGRDSFGMRDAYTGQAS